MPFRSILVLSLCSMAALSCGPSVSDRDIHVRVAEAYGFEGFDQIETIRYTLNVRQNERRFQRSWIWHVKADSVVYNDVFRYSRQDSTLRLNTDNAQIDRWFYNDMTWLLFPFHLMWDKNKRIVEADGPQPLPTGEDSAQKISVIFSGGGVLLDEVFHLYIGEDDRIVAWIYHAGGAEEATEVTSWEDHQDLGPITLSLDRNSPDGRYRVWFTDVGVKLVGREEWVEAR